MAIAPVQSAEGASALATTTASFPTPTTASNLIVLSFIADDYNGTPDSGWNQEAGMEQQGFHGAYTWWRISTGQTNFSYTIGSATRSVWALSEWSGVDASAYDASNGQILNSSDISYTTPSITPSAGDRLLIAQMGGSSAAALDVTGDWTTWLNGFTHLISSGTNGINPSMNVGVGYQLVTTNGATSYSSGASSPNPGAFTPQSRSGLIISFKASAGGGGGGGNPSPTKRSIIRPSPVLPWLSI